MSQDNSAIVKARENHDDRHIPVSTAADTIDDITIITVKQSNVSKYLVQEQTSLTSELSSIGTASAHSHPTVSTAAVASFQSGIEAQATMVPVGSFYSTLHNAGRVQIAVLLGNDIMNAIEVSVEYAARSTIIARATANVPTMFDKIATHVQILQSQIENWQRVHIGSNDTSFVVIDNQILGMTINEAIERLQNPN